MACSLFDLAAIAHLTLRNEQHALAAQFTRLNVKHESNLRLGDVLEHLRSIGCTSLAFSIFRLGLWQRIRLLRVVVIHFGYLIRKALATAIVVAITLLTHMCV